MEPCLALTKNLEAYIRIVYEDGDKQQKRFINQNLLLYCFSEKKIVLKKLSIINRNFLLI